VLANAVLKAERLYYLEHGEYSSNLESLTIEIPGGGKVEAEGKKATYDEFVYWIATNTWTIYISSKHNHVPSIVVDLKPGTYTCRADKEDILAQKVCSLISKPGRYLHNEEIYVYTM